MQRSKWFALLFLIGAFVAGAAVGVAGDRMMEHNRPHGPIGRMDRMARDLDLTAAQRAAFDSILENRQKQLREVYAPLRPQWDSLDKIGKVIRDSTHEQLRRILTPEQRVKFDRMHDEAQKRAAEARRKGERGLGPNSGPGSR